MIRIMTDAAADIPKELVEEYGIEILPFMIFLGEKSVLADKDLAPETFYTMLEESGCIPTTSQVSPEEVEKRYRRLGENGDSIIHITMSANGSGIYNTSCLVASQLKEEGFDIMVIDSTMFAYAIGYAVVEAAKRAKGRMQQGRNYCLCYRGVSAGHRLFCGRRSDVFEKGRQNQSDHHGNQYDFGY